MSGEAFNFLSTREPDEINERDVEDMAHELAERGFQDVAQETLDFMLTLRRIRTQLNARLNRLRPVWKAVEWVEAGDSSPGRIDDAVAKYRGGLV